MSNIGLSNTFFYFPDFIAFKGGYLSIDSILEYFYLSPFFDKRSINFKYSSKSMPYKELKELMRREQGFQYIVDERNSDYIALRMASKDVDKDPPSLFIIQKVRTQAGGKEPEVIDMFYCNSDYVIYKCPSVFDVYESRLAKAPKHLFDAFSKMIPSRSTPDSDNNNSSSESSSSSSSSSSSNNSLVRKIDGRPNPRLMLRDVPSIAPVIDDFNDPGYFDNLTEE